MRADYEHFDAIYRDKQTAGQTGWVDRDSPDWALHTVQLEAVLGADYCPPPGKALELGCGAGCWCIELARRGWDVTGVDLSPTAIAWARNKAAARDLDIRFVQASVLDLQDRAAGPFDFILDGFLLHCLIGPDRGTYLASARRRLAPRGVFRIQTFCAEDVTAEAWADWNIDPSTRCQIRDDGTALRYVGHPDEIQAGIIAAGFEILQAEIVPCAGGMLEISARRAERGD